MARARSWFLWGLAALLALGIGLKAADLGNVIYSETDASNSASTLWPEGMAPSAVNDNLRGFTGAVYRWYNHSQASTASTGSSNAYILTYAVTPAQYVTGDVYTFRANFANTASASLNVNGLGARSIMADAGRRGLQSGDIPSGQIVSMSYDPLRGVFQLLTTPANDLHERDLATTGSSNAYVLTYSLTPVASITGYVHTFRPNFSNTSTPTLNINGIGAVEIRKNRQALNSGDIEASSIIQVSYDGTYFELLSIPKATRGSSFLATHISNQVNMTGDGTLFTFIADTEIYDLGAEYDNATGVFTATIAGKYHCAATINIVGIAAGHNDGGVQFVASNRTLETLLPSPGAVRSVNNNFAVHVGSDIDMDALDTVSIQSYVSGSTKVVGSTGGGQYGFFSCHFVAP